MGEQTMVRIRIKSDDVRRQSGLGKTTLLGWALVAGVFLLAVPGCDEPEARIAEDAERSEAVAGNAGGAAEPRAERMIPRADIADIRDAEGNLPQRPTRDPMLIIEQNDLDELLGFLYWERDPDWQDDQGITLLIAAVVYGRPELVEALIRYGADIDAGGRMDMTALHWAVRGERVDMARLLLENGADPNPRGGGDGTVTPMTLAANRANREMIELLAEYGGRP